MDITNGNRKRNRKEKTKVNTKIKGKLKENFIGGENEATWKSQTKNTMQLFQHHRHATISFFVFIFVFFVTFSIVSWTLNEFHVLFRWSISVTHSWAMTLRVWRGSEISQGCTKVHDGTQMSKAAQGGALKSRKAHYDTRLYQTGVLEPYASVHCSPVWCMSVHCIPKRVTKAHIEEIRMRREWQFESMKQLGHDRERTDSRESIFPFTCRNKSLVFSYGCGHLK